MAKEAAAQSFVQDLWTRERFEDWLRENGVLPQVPGLIAIRSCACGDLNCHGWRLVASRVEP